MSWSNLAAVLLRKGDSIDEVTAFIEEARSASDAPAKKESPKVAGRLAMLNGQCRGVYDSLKSLGGSGSITTVWENLESDTSHAMVRYYLKQIASLDLATVEYKGGRNVFTLVA